MIEQSVGTNGVNNHNDVLIIQCALNVLRARRDLPFIAIDGIAGFQTVSVIFDFQRTNSGLIVDGRINAGGRTLVQLIKLLGDESFVFGPAISELLTIRDQLEALSFLGPQKIQSLFSRILPGLKSLNSFKDLAHGLEPQLRPNLVGFNALQPRFGFVGADDAAEAIVLAFMALLIAAFIVLLTQNPAFRKAVSVRAKELDRIMKNLQINASLGLKESVDLIISITNDTTEEQNRCRQSPTFQDSIECRLAMQNFANIAAKLRSVFPKLLRLVQIITTNPRSGFDIRKTRIDFNRLIAEAQQDAFDLQVALADLREKCKCPDE